MKNNNLVDQTPRYYIIKVSNGSEKGLIQTLITNKIEISEKDLAKFKIILEGELKWGKDKK